MGYADKRQDARQPNFPTDAYGNTFGPADGFFGGNQQQQRGSSLANMDLSAILSE